MPTTTLKKWGNSQGVIIPKAVCEYASLSLDDEMDIRVEKGTGDIVLSPAKRRYRRSGKVSAAELFSGWHGVYECPDDVQSSGSALREADWGEPQGKEMW